MLVRRLLCFALCAAAVAACGQPQETAAETAAAPAIPEIQARSADGFEDVGGAVADLALIPNTLPFMGRGLAALRDGDFALIDFTEGAVVRVAGPRVRHLAAAPDFQLRGSPAPLVVGAGGALATPQAWVFLAEDGLLVDMPMDPIAPAGAVRAMCVERATSALLDLIVFTDATRERWRISDRGGERLAAEQVASEPETRVVVACESVDGQVAGVTENGVARVLDGEQWGFSDGVDVASVPSDDGWWAIIARPAEQGATLIAPRRGEVSVVFEPGFNTPSTPAPTRVIASTANFGGSFGTGVLVVVQDNRLGVIELAGLMADAKEALSGMN